MKIFSTMDLRKRVTGVALLLAVALFADMALAGEKKTIPVVCTSNVGCAGDVGTARNSTDSKQRIGCYVVAGCFLTTCNKVVCSGTDATGKSALCSSTTTEFKQAAAGINGDSYVTFTCEGGTLKYLIVENSSVYQQKAH